MTTKPETIAKQVKSSNSADAGTDARDGWNPDFSGDIDIFVTRDCQWLFQGRPIPRPAIVQMFSRILRRENDGHYYLVTPVEKWRISVEDTPVFLHSLRSEGEGREQVLSLTTNTDDVVEIGEANPLQVGTYEGSDEPRPVVITRYGVEARLVTAAYYDLAELALEEHTGDETAIGVWSGGIFFKIAGHA